MTASTENIKKFDQLWLKRQSLQSPILNVTFEKHDNTSIEIDLNYHRRKQYECNKQNYQIEFFFFFPASLRLVKKGYKARDFFDTMISNLRMRSPKILPSEYFDVKKAEYPLYKLMRLKHQMLHDIDFKKTNKVRRQFKLLANYLISYFKNVNILDYCPEGMDIEDHLETEIKLSKEMLEHFRFVYKEFKDSFSNRFPHLISDIGLMDEYISYMLETHWSDVFYTLSSNDELHDIQNKISALLCGEMAYREDRNYNIPAKEHLNIKEYFVYRLGILKKFIQQQLYLNEKYIKPKSYLVQIIAMSAAGLAAFTALMLESMKSIISPIIGVPASILVLVSVVIYILKDRIKDVIKAIVGKKALRQFDREREIIIPSKNRQVFAHTKEIVSIIKKSTVPDDIKKIRSAKHAFEVDRTKLEDVIHYSKIVTIDWKKLEKNVPAIISELKEIYRFNLGDFMGNMDDPQHVFMSWNPIKKISEIVEFDKVYHINVILKLSSFIKKKEYCEESYYRVRLVVDRRGVRRIERISLVN